MNKLTLITLSVSLLFLSACTPTPYKNDINQGSSLDRFQVNQLKIGMSQVQVQNLIGSPSIIDPFHNNQWNYINHSTLHQKEDLRYRLVLTFDNKQLTQINTSDITSLPALTDKEKVLEEKRITTEIAAVLAAKQAEEKAAAEALARQVAKQKLAAEKVRAEKVAKARALKKKIEIEQAKQREIEAQNPLKIIDAP